jgi:serine O-acetyltransferase
MDDARLDRNPRLPNQTSVVQRIKADYRFYSGAFANSSKPAGGRLSRLWSASMKLGFWVLFSYRLRNALIQRGSLLRKLGELMGFWTKIATGCHISPKCSIGFDVGLPHPVGIVIGDRVVIKNRVRIYQAVTLGSDDIGNSSYPTVEDDVTIFANAVIIGEITVGPRAIVGAGAIVLRDVPPDCSAVGNPARIIQKKIPADATEAPGHQL